MYLTCQNTCKKLIKAVQENRTAAAGINASDSLCLVQVKAPHDATLVGDKVQNKFCSINGIPKKLLHIKRGILCSTCLNFVLANIMLEFLKESITLY